MPGVMTIAAGGMTADQNAMKNNSANLANSQTIGYMIANSDFMTQVSGGVSGVSMSTTNAFDQPGPVESTGRSLDLATNGAGFIPVQGPSGVAFKKTASCSLNKIGVLLDEAGNKILGMPNTAPAGVPPAFSPPTVLGLAPVTLNMAGNVANPTTAMTVNCTLPAQPTIPGPPPTFAPCVLQMQIYDSLGAAHMLNLTFRYVGVTAGAAATTQWTLGIASPDVPPPGGTYPYPVQNLSFNNVGTLIAPLPAVVPAIQFLWPNGSAQTNITLDISKVTLMGPAFSAGFPTQNGSGMGTFVGIDVDNDGTVSEVYSNGERKAVFQVSLAQFAAVTQLQRASGNLLLETGNSGPAIFSNAGTGGVGDLLGKSLVSSATDSMKEQVEMIGYSQANAANAGAFALGREASETVVSLMRGR